MRTHSDIVDAIGPTVIATDLDMPEPTVRAWKGRGRIPAEQWATFAGRGWATLEELAAAQPARRVKAA